MDTGSAVRAEVPSYEIRGRELGGSSDLPSGSWLRELPEPTRI